MVAIKEFSMPSCCGDCTLNDCFNWKHYCNITLQEIDFETDTRPTNCPLVEIEEIRIGKWIDCGFVDKSFKEYKCSNCGDSVYEKEYQIKYHKYCLHCGSRNEVENV